MPAITAPGTFGPTNPSFEFLGKSNGDRTLLFAGSTLPTTLEIKYKDDEGVLQTLEGGTITSLPASVLIEGVKRDLYLVATGGTPNFSVCGA